MIVNRNPRSYEVSIWTLQDSFITVLKVPYLEHKGQIEEPELLLKDDSEDTFSFRIPMYIRSNGEKIENPNWYNVRNGNLIADMRKLKVIFNKGEKEEQVFEFLVTKVIEKHEGFETWCEVESEGLAFHELGKTGYKIELSGDIYNLEYNEWADNDGRPETEPINNINYWIDKVLDTTIWNYEIQMDWSGYSKRDSNKVYEDAYISNWEVMNNALIPGEVVYETEKLRLVEEKESNRFNLLQTIAETFGVYCKFQYEYDKNYHIIGRKVIFYNNFFQENEKEVFDLNYHYDTEDIAREMDSTELITKMIVLNQSDSEVENSITRVEANPSLEDYLLNFDYLYSIGAISEEQYNEIKNYNTTIHELNVKINRLSERIMSYKNILIQVQSVAETAKQSLVLDQEGMQEEEAYIDYLLDKSGGNVEAKVLYITKDTARPYYPMGDERYVIPYDKYAMNVAVFSDKECSILMSGVIYEKDDEGFCIRVTNIPSNKGKTVNDREVELPVYLTYEYSPDLHHKIVYEQWVRKFASDTKILAQYQPIVEKLDGKRDSVSGQLLDKDNPGLIEECENLLNDLLEEKKVVMIQFENLMGPALREGTWQPEDSYSKYGNRQTVNISFNNPSQNDATLIWDNKLFEEEESNYYEEGVELNKKYLPCINVKGKLNILSKYVGNEIITENNDEQIITKQFGLIINDKIKRYELNTNAETEEVTKIETIIDNYKLFPIKYGFVGTGSEIIPVLILDNIQEHYAAIKVTDDFNGLEEYINSLDGKIGYLVTTVTKDLDASSMNQKVEETANIPIKLISDNELNQYNFVYPRIRFNNYNLKTTSDELKIEYNNNLLQENDDYYILSKYENENGLDINWDEITAENDPQDYTYGYYITIRPEVLFRYGQYETFNINYVLNNIALMIYLDAIQILKENSMPKVSYTITPKVIKKDFIKYLYSYMHHLVHINDYELKFNNVMGYISGIELKLDTPWEDNIEIKNYKTKFEDLFTSIVASTEAMKKNSAVISAAASAFTSTGNLNQKVLQDSISFADLNYAFNNGRLTINEKDGIWASNENGVVAFNGGGIFTATEKDSNGNWIWNTGLLPRGISASAITAGQLDTNLIRIYAGDDLRFQMNGEGLFAYKSWLDDYAKVNDSTLLDGAKTYNDRNPGQYVVHNSDGLFLIAEAGCKPIYEKIQKQSRQIKDTDKFVNWPVLKNNEDITEGFAIDTFIATDPLKAQVRRVEISWDGLKLSNWQGEPTFYADPDTGDLIIGGTLLQNASFITIPASVIENINEQLSPAASTLRSLKKGMLKGEAKAISELSNNEFHEFSEYVLNELENDYLRSEEEEKHVRFLTPNVAAVKVADYVNWSAASISNEILEDAFETDGRIENRLDTVAKALTEYGLKYTTILNNITEIQLVDVIPTSNVEEFTTIRLNKDVGTYKAGETYYYDGEKWNRLESRNINLYTGGNLNLLGANATFAAGSELKMLAGGKLHLFGGKVYISSTDIANNQTEQDKLAETPLNGIVMDNEGLAIYSTKNITLGTQTTINNVQHTLGLELNGNNGSLTAITSGAAEGAIKFYRIEQDKNNNDVLTAAVVIDGNGININSTNFQVNSNASSNEDIFYVGNNDKNKYIKYTNTNNGLLEIKGDICASNIYADGSYVYTGSSPAHPGTSTAFSTYAQNQASNVLLSALDEYEEGDSIKGAITKRLSDITGDYNGALSELNTSIKNVQDSAIPTVTSGTNPPSNPKTGDIFYNTSTGVQQIYYNNNWISVAFTSTGARGPLKERPDTANIGSIYQSTEGDRFIYTSTGWMNLDTATRIIGTNLTVDAEKGTIDLRAENAITIKSGGTIDLDGKNISLLANGGAISFITTQDGTNTNVFTMDNTGINMGASSLFSATGSMVYIGTKGDANTPGGSYLFMGKNNLLIDADESKTCSVKITSNNSNKFIVYDLYTMVDSFNKIVKLGDLVTFSFNWEVQNYNSNIKMFRVEVGSVSPYTAGTVYDAKGTKNSTSNLVDVTSDSEGHYEVTFKVTQNVIDALETETNKFNKFRIRIDGEPNNEKPAILIIKEAKVLYNTIQLYTMGSLKAYGSNIEIASYVGNTNNRLAMDAKGLSIATTSDMTIAAGGNMTIAAGGNMTIGTTGINDSIASLTLLSKGLLAAYGAEIRLATVDSDNFNNLINGTNNITGSYLWMHNKTVNNITKKVLDIGTTGDFQILSGGNFSALAAQQVLIATDQNFDTTANTHSGSYLWMHTKNNEQVLDIGTTGDFKISSTGKFSAVAASEVLIASASNYSSNNENVSYIWMHDVNNQKQLDIRTTGIISVNVDSLIIKTFEDEEDYSIDEYIEDSPINKKINTWFDFNEDGLTISNREEASLWKTVTGVDGYSVKYNDETKFSVRQDKCQTNSIKIGDLVIKKSARNGMAWVKE